MSLIENLVRDLNAKPGTKGNSVANCLAHDDTNAALHFAEKGDELLVCCFAGCAPEDIKQSLVDEGVIRLFQKVSHYRPEIWKNFDDRIAGRFGAFFDAPSFKHVGSHYYQDADGKIVAFRARFSPDKLMTFEYFGLNNNKIKKAMPLPPYRWPEVLAALKDETPIHVFDREEDADRAAAIGMVSSCFGAAKEALPTSCFSKFKDGCCVIWTNGEKLNRERATMVAASLHAQGAKVKVATIPNGTTFCVWQQSGAKLEIIQEVLGATPQWLPAPEQLANAHEKGTLPRTTYDVGTEAFAGEYYARVNKSKFRFLCDMKRWFGYDGVSWCEDKGGDAREAVKSLHEIIKRDMQLLDPVLRQDLSALATKVQGDAGVNAVMNMAKTIPSLRMFATDLDDPETRHMLSCKSGIIDFKLQKLVDHSPDVMITKHLDFEVDFHKDPQMFLQFIFSLWDDPLVCEWFLDYLGYCLTGDVGFQKFVMLIGEPGTGKSTIQSIMRLLNGPHVADLDADSLIATKQRSAAVDSDLASCRGSRVIFISELTPRHRLDERAIKALTGGDPLKVKFMGENKFNLKTDAKLIFTSNEPIMLSDDGGIARRLLEMRMEKIPDEIIDNLAEKIVAMEGPQVLGYLAKRAFKHYEDTRKIAQLPATLVGWTENRLAEMDVIKQWANLRTTFFKGAFETSKTLLDDFEAYCKENRIPIEITPSSFTRKLRKFGYFPDKNDFDQRGWRNVMLRP